MYEVLKMTSNRKLTFIFLAIGCILLIIAFVVGIADNPPGIVLFYIAVIALILAFVHRWRKVKNFLFLAVASIIGIVIFAILHNLFYALGKLANDIPLLRQLLNFLDALSFLIAIMLCPMGLLIGIVGSIVLYFKNKKRPNKN